ncbi:unnamed protein product, partial [Bubo scandiacus]
CPEGQDLDRMEHLYKFGSHPKMAFAQYLHAPYPFWLPCLPSEKMTLFILLTRGSDHQVPKPFPPGQSGSL